MSYLEKFSLPKGSKKEMCPGCRKRTFKPYVFTETGEAVDVTVFGRCDRENDCGYHEKPQMDKKEKKTYVINVIHPNENILSGLLRIPSNLHKALEAKGIPADFLYENGVMTTASGLTAFVFRDIAGNFCNIKYFKYKPDGKRDHEFQSYSLKQPEHQRNPYIKEVYTMPLFGEHELDPDKKRIVATVESEKSRVIAKWFYKDQDIDWVSCGSANGLSDGSEETADKIKPLKGRTVYWVCDNDKAARGKFVTDEHDRGIWQDCSSVRNGKKYIGDFHICDLFKDKEPGYDIGDALLDGMKPEIKPTWSKAEQDPRYQSYVPPSDYRIQAELAKQIGESSGISDEFDNTFSWMRTHVNAFYGWSNDGKGVMLDFLSIMKSKKSGWRHCMFKQEDMGSFFEDGKAKITGDRIYAKLAWTYMGKVPPPFEHYAKKHNLQTATVDEYHAAMEWVKKHFYLVNPKDRTYRNINDEFLFFYEVFGVDHFVIDPWNTVILDEMDRGDERLIRAFLSDKEVVLKTNSVMSIVNHAGSKHEVRDKKGAFQVVTQFMQLGGAAWDIKMDGQFSIHRPFRHKKANNPIVHFYNLKQRDSEIVGAERGSFTGIEFDRDRRQYYFDGVCPIDGSRKATTPIQETIPYTPSWKKGKKKDQTFEQHVQNDWASASDEPPWVTGN